MTIEIHQPELEALIQQRLESGEFETVEEVILDALRSSCDASAKTVTTPPQPEKSIAEVFAAARGLGDGVDFSRNRSVGRPIDL